MNSGSYIGRLTRDPELRFVADGSKAVANFTIAIDRDGSRDKADFLPVTVWGNVGENCANYLKKGSKVGITGSLESDDYEKDGAKIYKTFINAFRVEFLDSKVSDKPNEPDVESFVPIEDDDDVPF